MKTVLLDLKQSAYENGKKSGEYFRQVVDSKVIHEFPLTKKPQLKEDCIKILHQLKETYPVYYEEVRGKADGLGVDFIDYFSLMCPELFDFGFEHCTTIVCKKENGHICISHNEDDFYIDENFCLSKVWIDENNWFVTNDMYNMPFGNGISYNSYGLIKTINYTHEENYNLNYLPRYFGQRAISEAKSIDDLINICKSLKLASGFHTCAIDINTKQAVSIEVYHDTLSVVYIDDVYVHTNHYIHGDYFNNQKVDSKSNSIFRLNKATELTEKSEHNLKAIQNILKYRGEDNHFETSIFQNGKDPYITLFNFSFDTEDSKAVHFEVYVYQESFSLDYE